RDRQENGHVPEIEPAAPRAEERPVVSRHVRDDSGWLGGYAAERGAGGRGELHLHVTANEGVVAGERDSLVRLGAAEHVAFGARTAFHQHFDGAADLGSVDLRLDLAVQVDEPLETLLRNDRIDELITWQARRRRALALRV